MNENETIILTPVHNEDEEAPFVFPALDELKSWQRLQFIVWGLEALERQLWDSAERGWHNTTGVEFQSFLKLIRSLYHDKADSLANHNHEILYDEMLEKAARMW